MMIRGVVSPLVLGSMFAIFAEIGGVAFAEESHVGGSGASNRFHARLDQYQRADPAAQTEMLGRLLSESASRRKVLAALMETDPAEVLRQAVPGAVRKDLPRALQTDIEEDAELEGVVEVLHEHGDRGNRYRHTLESPSGRFSLHFAGRLPDWLTGDRVRVRGVRVQKALALDASGDGNVQMMGAALPDTFGPQKVLMLLVNFQDEPIQPYTVAAARSTLFTTTSAFYQENSYGQTSLTGDVFGWFTIPMSSSTCSDASKLAGLARSAATAAGVDVSAYSRYVYAFPLSPCGWAGSGTIGGSPSHAWINGNASLQIIGHELGHNFGLYHSHAMDCGTVVLGPSCVVGEYADLVDIMGTWTYHLNAFQKWRLGWLGYGASPPITTVQEGGDYAIDAYESPGTGPKALKIPRGTTGNWFYVEARRAIGFDSDLSTNTSVLNGVAIHQVSDSDPDSSMLLDMNPAASRWLEFPLQVGQTFTDPYSSVTMTHLSSNSAGSVVRVNLGSGAACSPSKPGVTATPTQSPAVQAGTTVVYTVAVKNNDSGPCTASSFGLEVTAPAGWQGVFTAQSVTVAPGATGTATLRITSAPAPAGVYTIVGTAVKTLRPSDSGAASIAYTLASVPGGGTSGSFSDNFNRTTLGTNWQLIEGNLSIVNNELRNAPSTGRQAAVVPTVAGSGQTVSASFATVKNSGTPTLGLILRYKDPKNYYLFYRVVGGASFLRLAKVVNGVTTVLASSSIVNPQANVLFRMTASASGSTLTLTVGTRTVSTIDTTFPIGSVGIGIDATKAALSHRAEDFIATIQ